MAWFLGLAKVLLLVQAAGPAVAGTIRDGVSGAPLEGAVVALPDLDRSTVSDLRGRYAFPDVPAGPQHVTVRRIGYAPRTLHALVPREGELEINIALHPDAFRLPAIEVQSAVAVRGVERGDSTAYPDRGMSLDAVRNHPLLAEPDVFQALAGGEIVLSPESPSGMHVRGGASDQTAFLLDGIPVFSPYHAAGLFSAWNPDALDRVQLSPSSAPASLGVLSGTVAGVTRTPGARGRAQGSASTSQARLTLDGPLGTSGAGYLVSVRSGMPDLEAPRRDPSYLRGHTDDVLAKLEAPVFGGRVRLLAYDSENELSAAAGFGGADTAVSAGQRNSFEWHSRSVGGEWTGRLRGVALRVQGWRATADAAATWTAEDGAPVSLASERQDEAILAAGERRDPKTATVAGILIQRSRTFYRVGPSSGETPPLSLARRTPAATAFIQHQHDVGTRLSAELALSAAATSGSGYLDPRAQLRWSPSGSQRLTLSGSYARSHQLFQSLRNPESVVGNVFPVDAYIGAGGAEVPVARADQGVLAATYRPVAGVRVGGQMYLRHFDGLLLVAPRTGEPFAMVGFATGSGVSRGFSVEAAMSGARYGLVASYGWQVVRLQYGDSSYVPAHGTRHLVEAGVILFPSATSSVRLGATGAFGRRATAISGSFEWEACNLLDRGCEFGGSPRYREDQLGASKLPPYLRVDLGLRQHWHFAVAGRDVQLALFGTVTNLLGRKNVLTLARDPSTGEPTEVEMRPRAPLVVGLDWRF